jgi:hypothetical protein
MTWFFSLRRLSAPRVLVIPARLRAWITRLPLGPDSEERAHFDRHPAGDDRFAPPLQRLLRVCGFQDPKTAYVLLGLQVRPVGDPSPYRRAAPQGFRVAGRGEATIENPGPGSINLFVECADIAFHYFALV